MRRYSHLLWLLVRECVASVGDLDTAGSAFDTSLFDSSNDLSSLDLNDGYALAFGNPLEPISDLPADDTSFLSLDSGDQLLFGDPNDAGSGLAAEDSLFNLDSQDTLGSNIIANDDSNALLIAGANTPSSCSSNNKNILPLSRNRARSDAGDFCVGDDGKPLPEPSQGYYTPLPTLMTDEQVKQYFCPTKLFKGILNIPVCALWDDFGLYSPNIFNPELMLSYTNVRYGKLSKSNFCSFFFFLPFRFTHQRSLFIQRKRGLGKIREEKNQPAD